MTSAAMTRAERSELAKLARQQERVAKADVDYRAAELLAAFEQQMAAIYSFDDDDVWRQAEQAAREATRAADAAIARRCEELGIPAQFRPSISHHWYGRGQNGSAKRRTELRIAAKTRIDAQAKRAKHEIACRSVEVQAELVRDGLTTEAARAFLEQMPTAVELMPALDALELDRSLPKLRA